MKKSEEDTPCLYCQDSTSVESWVSCRTHLNYSCTGLEEKDKRPCLTSELRINYE